MRSQLASVKQRCTLRKNEQVYQADLFKRQTLTFIFQHKFHIHLSIYRIYQVSTREWTAAIVASVNTRQNNTVARSFLLSNTFSFLHQTCIVGLVKQLSQYTGYIFECIALVLSCLAQRKWMTECRSLWGAFSGNVAICNVHNWRHSDVIVIKLTAFTKE